MNSPDYHNPDSFLVRMAWVTFAGESWGSRVCDMIWLPFMLRRIIKTQKKLAKNEHTETADTDSPCILCV